MNWADQRLLEDKRRQLEKLDADRRAQWSTEGCDLASTIHRCWAFHELSQRTRALKEELAALEARLGVPCAG